jgi:hypothetical protein
MVARTCFLVSASGLVEWKVFARFFYQESIDERTRLRALSSRRMVASQHDSASHKATLASLMSRLSTLRSREPPGCSDVRDIVYSLIGLVEDGESFTVDYQCTRTTLFLETVRHFKLAHPLRLQPLADLLRVEVKAYCLHCSRYNFGTPFNLPAEIEKA